MPDTRYTPNRRSDDLKLALGVIALVIDIGAVVMLRVLGGLPVRSLSVIGVILGLHVVNVVLGGRLNEPVWYVFGRIQRFRNNPAAFLGEAGRTVDPVSSADRPYR